jgi:FMN-dependent oxidoreductase (nitrilotriacetate monooxygenase family)
MAERQMRLAAFCSAGPVSGHHGGWRYPSADRNMVSAAYYRAIGQALEKACFDLLFIADVMAVPNRLEGSMDSQLRYGALGALRLDPIVVLSVIAAHTSRLGLGATVSTSYTEPYLLARAMATLDHLSGGRAAWNIVTSFQAAEARNFGLTDQLSHDERYDRADEYLNVVCKLWDSWADDALVLDPVTPLFADPAKVHAVDHHGRFFDVEGPLNVSRGPQGRPVFIQAGASERGRDFAARWAEIVFVTHASLESGVEFYRDMKRRAVGHGRDPDTMKILPGISPVVGETRAVADEKKALLDSLADAKAGLSTLAYHLDIDLAQFPQDEVLPEMDVPGVHGHYKEVAELTQKQGLSLAQVGKRYGAGSGRGVTGTAKEVADRLEQWFLAGAADGFMVQAPWLPGGVEDFARLVVPELQARGLFRTEYGGPMLRDQLGLPRPAA